MKEMLLRCTGYSVVAALIYCAIAAYFLKGIDARLWPGALFTGVATLLISFAFYSYFARRARTPR